MIAIVNAFVIKPDHIIENGVVLCEGDKIVYAGKKRPIPDGAEIVDAGGNFVGPGLIDIHTHAGGGCWFHEHPVEAAAAHLAHGTTSVYPALYFNLTREQYIKGIRDLREASKSGPCRIIRGLYMEGPYLNPKFGCDQDSNKWKGPLNSADYMPIIKEAGDFARFWCLAPERDKIKDFALDVKRENPDIIFTVAHSEASPEQIEALIPLGLKVGTHHTNATGDRPKYPECRGVCVDETVNSHDDIYAEIICDSMGIHVDPYMQRLVVKIKGRDKVILISDACVFFGPIPEGYDGVTDICFDFDGQIAGSKLTLDKACRNMMMHTGASICDVFRYASLNPARLMGDDTRGRLEEGAAADIIIVDGLMNVRKVMLNGKFE